MKTTTTINNETTMQTMELKQLKVFNGQKRYTDKKVNELKKRGYKVIKKFQFGDNSTTYVMEKE
jgi:hypothetical protein